MKKGDVVKFKGFALYNASPIWAENHKTYYGIVIRSRGVRRFDVLWNSGHLGENLYGITLEVISEYKHG